jgi:N-acetylmuramoyl-L-alanine amidase
MHKFIAYIIYFVGLLLVPDLAGAKQLQIADLRFWSAPDHTRLVFDTTALPRHQVFTLQNPDRLVVDIANAKLGKHFLQPAADHNLLYRIRSGARNQIDLRIVMDLKKGVKPKSFILKPSNLYGHRLVIDLFDTGRAKSAPVIKPIVKQVIKSRVKEMVVAIDAGHGGEDPGAHGPHGVQEKKVVLAVAKKLVAKINARPGIRAFLVRKGDYYVGLRKRLKIARQARADLFISIHADAFHNAKVRGASVYTLSRGGASSEAARWLANQENASDLVGGVSLDDKEDVLASVLLDLSQTATQDMSAVAAKKILGELNGIVKLHKRSVQAAKFIVLKSPDIPSVLIETAYISNPTEERRLKSPAYQNKIAEAIYRGVNKYYQAVTPVHLAINARAAIKKLSKHKIMRGETLSEIAVRYGVSMSKLKNFNALKNNMIKIGQVLTIPKS